MQKISPVFCLRINCKEGQHEEYMEFKHKFETFFYQMQNMIRTSEQKGVTPHLIEIGDGKYLSFCIANKQLILGIYDSETEDVTRQCEYDDLKKLDFTAYNLIEYRIENILHQKNKDILHDAKLNKAWGKEIVKIKMEIIKEAKEAKERKEKDAQTKEFEKQSIFTNSFSDACKHVADKNTSIEKQNEAQGIKKPRLPNNFSR